MLLVLEDPCCKCAGPNVVSATYFQMVQLKEDKRKQDGEGRAGGRPEGGRRKGGREEEERKGERKGEREEGWKEGRGGEWKEIKVKK